MKTIAMYVHEDNVEAQALYASLGYFPMLDDGENVMLVKQVEMPHAIACEPAEGIAIPDDEQDDWAEYQEYKRRNSISSVSGVGIMTAKG